MSAQKPQPKKRRLVLGGKPAKTMTIKDRRISEVRPPRVNAAHFEGIELKAEDDCQVIFKDFTFVLNKGQSQVVSFSGDGNYHFDVKYLGHGRRRRRAPARTAAAALACMVLAPRALILSAQVMSGPTGDIRVP